MKAVVTGANGFVGAAVCKQLQQAGYEVLAVVRSENSDTSRLSSCSTLRYIFCDMNNYVSLPEKIPDRDISIFFHFAWDGVAGTSRFDDTQQLKMSSIHVTQFVPVKRWTAIDLSFLPASWNTKYKT